MRRILCKRDSGQEADEPDKVSRFEPLDGGDLSSVVRWNHRNHSGAFRRLVLQVQHGAALVTVRNLERELASVIATEEKVLVALAGQLPDECRQTVQRPGEVDGVIG